MGDETIGVDIAKLHFDVHSYPAGESGRFENTGKGRRSFLKWLKGRNVVMVVFEPTGPYHKALEADLHKAGVPLAKVNPLHARRFAEATGCLNKTDRVDAAILARMANVLQIKAQPERPENLTGLTEITGGTARVDEGADGQPEPSKKSGSSSAEASVFGPHSSDRRPGPND